MSEGYPVDWLHTDLGSVTQEEDERVGKTRTPVVLSSTKHRGLVPSLEYFKKTVFSDNLSNYKMVLPGWFAYATNHLSEGSIGLQQERSDRCVSPVYTVFSCGVDVHPPYLFRLLKQPDFINSYKIHEQASVDRRGAVRYSDFRNIPIALPSLAEQRKIAEILDTVDENIRSTERLIAKLEQAKRGVVDALFESPFCLEKFGQYIDQIDAGSSPDLPDRPAVSGEWGVLKVSSVRALGFFSGENKAVNKRSLVDRRIEVRAGDLLITRANTPQLVGLACYVNSTQSGLMLSDKVLRLLLDERSVDPEFISHALALPVVRRQIETFGTGSSGSMKNISQQDIRALRVPVIPLGRQEYTIEVLRVTNSRVDRACDQLAKLRKVKQGLMEDLLTGKVRVNVDEAV